MNESREAELSALSSDLRQLLLRRSERISRHQREADGEEDVMWVASFTIGDQEYAIALSKLRAALPLRAVTAVPHSSRVVVGVLQFQGEVISALSTAALLESGWSVDPTVLLVVEVGADHIVALDCAQVPVATGLPLSAYREAVAASPGALAIVPVPGRRPVIVVDLGRLLEDHSRGDRDG
jgi:chemotaxis signal transduction protein